MGLTPKVNNRKIHLEYVRDSESTVNIELDGINDPHKYAIWKITLPSKFAGLNVLYYIDCFLFNANIRDAGAGLVEVAVGISTSTNFALANFAVNNAGTSGVYVHRADSNPDPPQFDQNTGLYIAVIGFVTDATTSGRVKFIDASIDLTLPIGSSVSRIA